MAEANTYLKSPDGLIDTTCRRICKTFAQYEGLYDIMACLTCMSYLDSGIIKKLFESGLIGNNDDLMNRIFIYNKQYLAERRAPLKTQKGLGLIPHESYALGSAPDLPDHSNTVTSNSSNSKPSNSERPFRTKKYATYVSTNKALTALIINGLYINHSNSEYTRFKFEPTDVIISFKGTNTLAEVVHDMASQLTGGLYLGTTLNTIGLNARAEHIDSKLNSSFTKVLLDAWAFLIQAVTEHSGKEPFRLFCTGHSLGGAYATIFGFLLSYLKENYIKTKTTSLLDTNKRLPEIVNRIKSIHIISLGSPKLCDLKLRNIFNNMLGDSFTFDRLVSQFIPTLSDYTNPITVLSYGVDVVPNLPFHFSHPGFKPAKPYLVAIRSNENPKQPYQLKTIAKLYNSTAVQHSQSVPEELKSELKELEEKLKEELKNVPEDPETPAHKGGGIFGGLLNSKNKREFREQLKKYSSNFISLHIKQVPFSHIYYLGMQYICTIRFRNMKNPAPHNQSGVAYFEFYDQIEAGVRIKYAYPNIGNALKQGALRELTNPTPKSGSATVVPYTPGAQPTPAAVTGAQHQVHSFPYLGGRKTKRRRGERKTRRA